MDTALNVAHDLAQNASISMRLLKSHMRRAAELDLEAAMQLEVDADLECEAAADLVEGTRAFVERRAPRYRRR